MFTDLDPGSGVAEDRLVALAVAEQRSQGDQQVAASSAVVVVEDGQDLVAGDLAEVMVVRGPVREHRSHAGEEVPGGLRAAGLGAGSAVVQGAQPGLDVVTDAAGEPVELALEPGLERGPAVVDQHVHLGQDLGDPFDADLEGAQRGEHRRVGDDLTLGVHGQHDPQATSDVEAQAPFPATGLAEAMGAVKRPGQPRVGRVGVDVGIDGCSPAAGRAAAAGPGLGRDERPAPVAAWAGRRDAVHVGGPATRVGAVSSGRRTAGGHW